MTSQDATGQQVAALSIQLAASSEQMAPMGQALDTLRRDSATAINDLTKGAIELLYIKLTRKEQTSLPASVLE